MERFGHTIRYTIADTGIGINPTDIPELFRRFMRTREAQKIQAEGTGLGLYVAKTIITAQGGKIWAESEGAGKGSKFIFELPEAPSDFKEEVVHVSAQQDYLTV